MQEAATPEPEGTATERYRPHFHVCDYCGTADNGTNPRHVFTSDDDGLHLCRVCVAACMDIVDELYEAGRNA